MTPNGHERSYAPDGRDMQFKEQKDAVNTKLQMIFIKKIHSYN